MAARHLRARGDTLADLIRSVPGYRSITAPDRLDHRFLREHVHAGLIPTISLARYARVPVPVMEGVVELACALLGRTCGPPGATCQPFLPVSCPDSTLQEVRLS